MYKSVVAHEKVVKHLRSLYYQGSTPEQIQDNKDLLEEVLAARKDIVERLQYLEVAFDYDWEAAKVYREMKEANPSSIVLKAVTEAKKRKAAGKTKDTDEKKKRKNDDNNNYTPRNSGWRSSSYQQSYQPQQPYWQPPAPIQAPYYNYQNAYHPPAAPYGRQTNTFRPSRPPGCFTCGEASHGFRRCPNANAPPPPPPPSGKPPPPAT